MRVGLRYSAKYDDKPAPLARLRVIRLRNPAMGVWLRTPREVDWTHDVPYIAGMSHDGMRVYIDRHMPRVVGDSRIGIAGPLAMHEMVEWWLVTHKHMGYEAAHHIATAAERVAVESIGHEWEEYESALRPHFVPTEHEVLECPPKDLALYPYTGKLYRVLWEVSRGKITRHAAGYRQSSAPMSRCGVCQMFRSVTHGCGVVAGPVEAMGVCQKFTPKTADSHDRVDMRAFGTGMGTTGGRR